MSNIFLVRHGQDTDSAKNILNGRRNTKLTVLGKEQAKTVANKLKDDNIQVIYSSPLKRTLQTARIIAKELNIEEVIIEKGLIEREFGILTGKPLTDIPKYANKILKTEKVNYFLEVEGSEDFPVLYKRAKRVLSKLQKNQGNKNILIVTHGDIGKMIRAVYHNWFWKNALKTPYFDNAGVLKLSSEKDVLE